MSQGEIRQKGFLEFGGENKPPQNVTVKRMGRWSKSQLTESRICSGRLCRPVRTRSCALALTDCEENNSTTGCELCPSARTPLSGAGAGGRGGLRLLGGRLGMAEQLRKSPLLTSPASFHRHVRARSSPLWRIQTFGPELSPVAAPFLWGPLR